MDDEICNSWDYNHPLPENDEAMELLSWEILMAGLSDRADEAMHEDELRERYGDA